MKSTQHMTDCRVTAQQNKVMQRHCGHGVCKPTDNVIKEKRSSGKSDTSGSLRRGEMMCVENGGDVQLVLKPATRHE